MKFYFKNISNALHGIKTTTDDKLDKMFNRKPFKRLENMINIESKQNLKDDIAEINKIVSFLENMAGINNDLTVNEKDTVYYKLGQKIIKLDYKSFGGFKKECISIYRDLIFYRNNKSCFKDGVYLIKKNDFILNRKKLDINYLSKFKNKKCSDLKALAIFDEFSLISWRDSIEIYELNGNTPLKQIENSTSDLLLIESFWLGKDGCWVHACDENLDHNNKYKLKSSIKKAQERGITVVFWNKEDPLHYDKYIEVAKLCDIVLTTDSNKINQYKVDVGHTNVFCLPFAANHYICNPMNRSLYKEKDICFAGAYYSDHPDRKIQMDVLLPSLLEFNGAIFDRMSSKNKEVFKYPKKYREIVQDGVNFDQMTVLYKSFKIFLNVNTVTNSPTMMSRRVYELLASGTPVISTESLALESQFKDIVQIANNSSDAIRIVKELLEDPWKYKRLSHKGYVEVMLNHTYHHRERELKKIIKANNIDDEVKEPLVSIISATKREYFIERLVESIKFQSYSNIECVIVTQDFSASGIIKLNKLLSDCSNLKKYIVIEDNSSSTLGDRLNSAAEHSTGDYLAKLDDDDFYFPNYLRDMMIPFSYGNFALVGKREMFFYLEELDKTGVSYLNQSHQEAELVAGATFIIKRSVFNSIGGFSSLNRGEDSSLIEKLKERNLNIYAADPFNYLCFRARDPNQHTWQVTSDFFVKHAKIIQSGFAKDLVKI